jgi:glycosyltransferase involved in cell wall biosynthesis
MPGTIASCDAGLCLYEDIEYFPQFYFSPLKLYEYMASAIPVIGQDIGQIREVLQSHDAGLLTDGTVEDLAHKILQLQADPGAAREMGNRGREAILESHSWAHVAQATEHFLQALRNSNREMARGPSC